MFGKHGTWVFLSTWMESSHTAGIRMRWTMRIRIVRIMSMRKRDGLRMHTSMCFPQSRRRSVRTAVRWQTEAGRWRVHCWWRRVALMVRTARTKMLVNEVSRWWAPAGRRPDCLWVAKLWWNVGAEFTMPRSIAFLVKREVAGKLILLLIVSGRTMYCLLPCLWCRVRATSFSSLKVWLSRRGHFVIPATVVTSMMRFLCRIWCRISSTGWCGFIRRWRYSLIDRSVASSLQWRRSNWFPETSWSGEVIRCRITHSIEIS
mmetsp:Transcript_27747/g.45881  ORF Transcript_27747/g.45881 Transcript_27747/m.45881 type:complete len:260 (+) Transcript_27747:2386-3165(+)